MVNVAVMGHGTVGSGVVEILLKHEKSIADKADGEIRVKYILDLKDVPAHLSDRHVKDFSIIENDPEVDVVVEAMGGVGAALDFTRRALMAGKNVVTSNKAVVADYGYELTQLAKEKGVCYLFEASVGGGIPVIRPLSQCLAANEIREIRGILNGTTNYILTRMIRAGLSFEEALAEAQQKGYAESDPSADVLGHDACRKICILSSLAFGRHVYPRQVPAEGITGITLSDVDYAAVAGKKIKLLGRAVHLSDNEVCACVEPHLVDEANPLASVEDVFNAIAIRGDSVGDVMFYGPGAGKLPTASAVVADIMDIALHHGSRKPMCWGPGSEDAVSGFENVASKWYVRAMTGENALQSALGEVEMLSKGGVEDAGITTDEMTRGELESRLSGVEILSVIRVLD